MTPEERRERKRKQDREAYLRGRERGYVRPYRPRKSEPQSSAGQVTPHHIVPAAVLEERDRAFAAALELSLSSILMGDPVPGRRAIDKRESSQ
jgi:hypothetical protein